MIPVPPAIAIAGDYGGQIDAYQQRVEQWRRDGRTVRITGPCASACTLVLALPRTCVEGYGALGFHAASGPEGTAALMRAYPPRIRAWIADRGGLSGVVRWLTGPELWRRMPVCREE